MSLTWAGDRGRGHPNSPVQAELQVGLAWGNPGIALTTAARPAMRQGPGPAFASGFPLAPRVLTVLWVPPKGPTSGALPDASQQPIHSLGVLPKVPQG